MEAKGGESGPSTKMIRSVDTLKELYTVAVGVALVMAVEKLANAAEKEPVFRTEQFFLFVVVIVTLIPFYHGAFRHMDDIYIFPKEPAKRPGPLVLLGDYLVLMFEAGLLVWLATSISDRAIFADGFLLLLLVDICWAVATAIFTPAGFDVVWWGVVNLITLLILLALWYWPGDMLINGFYLMLIAIARSVADYVLSRKLYFPED
jgi:hypothetical protein